MPSRQYLWTSTAIPLACFFAAIAWPELKPTRTVQAVAIVAALAVVAGNVVATFRRPLRNDSRELALLEKHSPPMKALQRGRPMGLVYDRLGEIEEKNLMLIAEWIRFRYRHLPRSPELIAVDDVNGCLWASVYPDVGWFRLIGLH